MAKQLLEADIKRKVESILRTRGQNIEDLTEGELTNLYWGVLSETITTNDMPLNDAEALAKKTDEPVIIKDFEGRGESIQVTDGDDDDNKSYMSELEEGELDEEEIIEMVKENQNAVMSKSELIQEMRSQIVNEENKYEDELESGDNEYSKHLDPDSVRDMGRRLYNDIRQAAQEKLGGANFDRASAEMSRALMSILQYEMDKKPQLQEEAIRLIRTKYPAMTEDVVDIEATITGHPDLGGTAVDRGDMRYEKGDTPPPTGYSEEEIKSEVTKRRFINSMAQGSARKTQNLHHLADNSRVPRQMKDQYGKLMAANDFVYWAMDREQIRQQGRGGVHAGNSKVQLNHDTGKPKIIVQGVTFSILLHELDKGIKELIALHGTHEDMELNKYVQDQVDHLDAEQDDIRLGVGIWEKVSQKIDIDNPAHEALLFHKLVSLPATEMNSIIKGLVSDNENSIDKLQSIADEASDELREEEYDDAMGTYDEKPEQPPMGDDDGFPNPEQGDDGEYDDPVLKGLMGDTSQEEPSGEIDYSTMSKPDLQRAMDDALDAGDIELAGEIGPYLH